MSKQLILAEKPSVGRDIARVLGCKSQSRQHFESNKYIVTWALGHLVTLAPPEKYNKAYSQWSMEQLPMIPKYFKLEVIPKTSKQFYFVKKQMERKDVTSIIIATDAGREGELVARWILDYANVKKPIQRLWISSVTDKAIKEGFSKLKDGRNYNPLYYAAKARAEADWIVGLNGSRALTCKFNTSLSLGRVQTPTLQLVADREEAIRNFRSKTFYMLSLKQGDVTLHYEKGRLFDQEKASQIHQACRSKKAVVSKKTSKEKTINPGQLYDLTQLQMDANRLFGFSAKQTLNTMQNLYERHKVLTYPRTDSRYLTSDIVGTLKERVQALRRTSYQDSCKEILRSPIKKKGSFVNDAKVGDHHAIIPTEQMPDYTAFSNQETKIYNLVVERFLEVLLPPQKYIETSLEVLVDGKYRFLGKSQGDVSVKEKDLLEAYVSMEEGQTKAPGYLTEGDLLHEMERYSLGTVATRSDIIEKIINNGYVEMMNQSLRTTKTGRQLLELVPNDIRSKELTGEWERKLERIAKDQLRQDAFLKEMVEFTKSIIHEIKIDTREFKHDNLSTETCPDCGKRLLVIKGKHGKRLQCPDRNCNYRRTISKVTNARCPECHSKMDLVGDKDKQTFICSRCGHKEKMESFQKRRKERGNSMSKKEVQRYMNKKQSEETLSNNPFAALLKDQMDDLKK